MNRPQVIHLDDVPVTPAAEAVTRVRIARVITRERCGSNLMLGASWLDPGEQTNLWSSRDDDDMKPGDHWYGPVDEVYYIIAGRLELSWDEGTFALAPRDCVYLAPGWTYSLKNVGDDPAFFVYAMTPSPQ